MRFKAHRLSLTGKQLNREIVKEDRQRENKKIRRSEVKISKDSASVEYSGSQID
jgi:hypothetical protein